MKKFEDMKFSKPNIEKINKELGALIETFKNASSFKEQDKAFMKVNAYMDKISTNITIGEIRFSQDTTNKRYIKDKEIIDEVMPLISAVTNEFNKALVTAKFKDQLELKWGKHLFEMASNSLKCFDEKIIPEMQELNKLYSQYSSITSSAQIPYKDGVYNLSQLSKFGQSADRQTRKEATTLAAKFFEENDEKIGEIYDKMVHLRDTMAKKLGYKNFIELGYRSLGRTDYDDVMVANYRKQIYTDLVPFTNKLFAHQAKRLKIKNPQFYDFNLNFLSGNPTPLGDTEFMVNQAQIMYGKLSNETDVFFKFMRDYNLLDLEARAGKQSGGYMTYLPVYKAPFIFSNFNGTSGDVDVLTHEFGHAFQGYMSRNIKCPDYRSPTLEACEIHSMSMEFITYPYMDLFFGENEEKYRYAHLADAITFIPYGVTVDEFQHWVYENPNVTHQQRCEKWREIEKKYLPHKKYDDAPLFARGGWWLRQDHIFSAPFYYIDYTLAQVCAFQFFIENEKNHEKTWKKYVKFCKLGGKYPFTELLAKGHLNNPFVDGSIKKIIRPLNKYLNSIDDSKY